MATFDFPYHIESTEYPDNGDRLALGRGWSYATKPSHEGQRTFNLRFPAMRFMVDDAGDMSITTKPTDTSADTYDTELFKYHVDMGRLEQFYRDHGLWKEFTYPHPRFGDVPVKFSQPLRIPAGKVGGSGAIQDLELVLIEEPS